MDESGIELFEKHESRFVGLGKKNLPKFLQGDLPSLRIVGEEDPVDDVIVRGVVAAFSKERESFYRLFREIFERDDADAFALAALDMWKKGASFHGRYKWMAELIATFGGDHTAIELERHLQRWQTKSDTWRKRAISLMYVLERIDTPTSLMALVGLTQRQERPSVYDEAVRQLDLAATRRHMSWETLADQVVPTCALDMRGTRVFDLGGRTLQVILDEGFTPRLRDEERELFDDIPARVASDDAELYKQAESAWELMHEQLIDVLDIQTRRMEHAMVSGRRWKPEDWKRSILEHPLMINFARRLVWGSFDKQGNLIHTFRATEDHSLMDVDDEEVELDMTLEVGILHPASIPDKALQDWAQSFAEYELFSPFQQLDRLVVRLPGDVGNNKWFKKYEHDSFTEGALRRLMKEEMWRRETGAGMIRNYFYKDFSDGSSKVRAFVDLLPGLNAGGAGWDPDQTIPKVRFVSLGSSARSKSESLCLKDVPEAAFSEACRFVEMVKLDHAR